MHMLRENKIPGLLEVRGRGAGENSQYYYDISCKVSMKTKYEKIPIGYEELKAFLYQLLTVMKEMKKYFLSENKVILNQSLFIMKRECSFFLFLPRLCKRDDERVPASGRIFCQPGRISRERMCISGI